VKSAYWVAVALFIGVAVGFVAGGGSVDRTAKGQGIGGKESDWAEPRFQMATWATSTPPGSHGCYILNTVTGELWHAKNEDAPKKLANEMPKTIDKK